MSQAAEETQGTMAAVLAVGLMLWSVTISEAGVTCIQYDQTDTCREVACF